MSGLQSLLNDKDEDAPWQQQEGWAQPPPCGPASTGVRTFAREQEAILVKFSRGLDDKLRQVRLLVLEHGLLGGAFSLHDAANTPWATRSPTASIILLPVCEQISIELRSAGCGRRALVWRVLCLPGQVQGQYEKALEKHATTNFSKAHGAETVRELVRQVAIASSEVPRHLPRRTTLALGMRRMAWLFCLFRIVAVPLARWANFWFLLVEIHFGY